jgi:hypothetical protein
MRAITLLLLVAITACGSGLLEDPVFIDSFIAQSLSTRCEPVPQITARRSAIRDVVTASDTSFLILYDEDREVAIIGPDLELRHRIVFHEDGPTGVKMPAGVALLGDSLLYIADQTEMRLKILDLQGRDRGTIPLDFAPQHLQRLGDQLLITPFVIANHPRTLLFTLENDRIRSLPITTNRYRDGLINILANTASIATYPDGRIVLTHAMITPFAQVLTLSASAPDRSPLPLPDGVRDRYGWLPSATVTAADADSLLVGTIASAADQKTGDLIYLTKTGRINDRGSEKALIRVDRDLRFLRSYLLDVNAVKMAYLAERDISLITTPENEWYSCPTP